MNTINVIEIKLFPENNNEMIITNLTSYKNSVNGNISAKSDFRALLKHYFDSINISTNIIESQLNQYSNIGFYLSNDGHYQLAIADSLPLQFLM